MKKLLANLSLRQRLTIATVAVLAATGLWALVHWQRESDFKPLYTSLAPEDAAAIVQKLRENGVEYRLPEPGGSVLVPSAKLAELRLTMAAEGLPKTGRIGFELFDKTNLGATEFAEHVNYRRAVEGELERSVMSLAEVEQARVHITFPKDSVFVEEQQPAKASALVKLRPGMHLNARNVEAIDHLIASAVEGLAPEQVSVVDMNGNLLGRPRKPDSPDGVEGSEEALEYRHKAEAELLSKVNSTLEPLLGVDRFHAGVSLECDFSALEQSEELFDPARSVMLSSQRSEDVSGAPSASGTPGMASNLPRPTSRPASGGTRVSRVTENITYQSSRTVKKTRLPSGSIRRLSLAVLVDQDISWVRGKNGYQRVLVPPSAEKLKVIHDVVAGVSGFSQERGDQIVIETLPFESTLQREPPPEAMERLPKAPEKGPFGFPWPQDRKVVFLAAGAALATILTMVAGLAWLLRRRGGPGSATVSTPAGIEEGAEGVAPALQPGAIPDPNSRLEAKLAERDALQQKMDAKVLEALKLTPVITKKAEILAKHLRETIKLQPEVSIQILRSWIREEER
ncbi:MAG: flagellar basal-body MS-ring/collar protein FliF [Bryobacteraceae bacterium]|jgi:flagellar M-ring protein FliF